jgi:hypothetical protein
VFPADYITYLQMKLKNMLPTTGDPGKITTGVLGSVLGNKTGRSRDD